MFNLRGASSGTEFSGRVDDVFSALGSGSVKTPSDYKVDDFLLDNSSIVDPDPLDSHFFLPSTSVNQQKKCHFFPVDLGKDLKKKII